MKLGFGYRIDDRANRIIIYPQNVNSFYSKMNSEISIRVCNISKYSIPFHKNGFINSKENLIFLNSSFINFDINKIDKIIWNLKDYFSNIITGNSFDEFSLKIRPLLSYYDYCNNFNKFTQHFDFNKPLGESYNRGTVEIVGKEINRSNYITKVTFKVKYSFIYLIEETLCFNIDCFHPNWISKSNTNEVIINSHIIFNRLDENDLEEFIMKALSLITFSSRDELLIKLSCFSNDLSYLDVLSVPLCPGNEFTYELHS